MRTFFLFHISEYAVAMEISQYISMYKSNWVSFLLEDYIFQTSSKVLKLAPKILLKFPLTSRRHTENMKNGIKCVTELVLAAVLQKTHSDFLYSLLVALKASILRLCTPDIPVQCFKESKYRFSKRESEK